MSTNESVIAARLHDVDGEIERLRAQISSLEIEKAELEVAGRVIARLTGATLSESSARSGNEATKADGNASSDKRPVTDLIEQVMREKLAEGMTGVEPKDVAPIIRERWRPDVSGTYVSTTFWRMWKQGKLEKSEDSPVYSLPKKKEPDGVNPLPEAPSGSLFSPRAKGREAGPGGGT